MFGSSKKSGGFSKFMAVIMFFVTAFMAVVLFVERMKHKELRDEVIRESAEIPNTPEQEEELRIIRERAAANNAEPAKDEEKSDEEA